LVRSFYLFEVWKEEGIVETTIIYSSSRTVPYISPDREREREREDHGTLFIFLDVYVSHKREKRRMAKPSDLESLKQQLVLWSSRGVGVETSKAFQGLLKKLRKNKTQAYS